MERIRFIQLSSVYRKKLNRVPCKKVSFDSKEEATVRINQIALIDGSNRKPIRSYRCCQCNKFHLTSWSKGIKRKVDRLKRRKAMLRINSEINYHIKKLFLNRKNKVTYSKKKFREILRME